MSDEIKMTPETGMTDEEIAELEKQREAAKEARLAPFKALRQRMDAGLRYAVANDGVTDEELLTMSAATPEWKPGMTLDKGDTVVYDGNMYVYIGEATYVTVAGHEPGTATQALYRRVKAEGSNEWQPDTDYIGEDDPDGKEPDEVTYDGLTYTCQLSHTSQAGWEPPTATTLWKLKTE